MARFVLTAGYRRSLPCVILAEALLDRGHEVSRIIVVSPLRIGRIRHVLRQRGIRWLLKRMRGRTAGHVRESDLTALAAEHAIISDSLKELSRRQGVRLLRVRSLETDRSVQAVEGTGTDAVIYCGGGILRRRFLAASPRVLNAHAGPLPQVRGMNAAEWALLLGEPPEVTVHLIDEGIDTGPILLRKRYDRSGLESVQQLRDRAVATGVRALLELVDSGRWNEPGTRLVTSPTRQCFIMAPVLIEVVEERLRR